MPGIDFIGKHLPGTGSEHLDDDVEEHVHNDVDEHDSDSALTSDVRALGSKRMALGKKVGLSLVVVGWAAMAVAVIARETLHASLCEHPATTTEDVTFVSFCWPCLYRLRASASALGAGRASDGST